MTAPVDVRDANATDRAFLRRMLVEASYPPDIHPRPTPAQAMREPIVARYLAGWGRDGDMAVIALGADGGRRGAAWYRRFTAEAPGYGFVEPGIPELAIAVSRQFRGQRIGTRLLGSLLDRASVQGVAAVSLSVSLANPAAMAVYRRAGFEVVSEQSGYLTMVWRRDIASAWPIRDAAEQDLAALNGVFRRSSLSNEGDRELLLAHPGVLVITAADLAAGRTRVAFDGQRIVGFATTRVIGRALELDDLFVDPERMRQGVATALVADAVRFARDHGLDAIEVTGNDHATGFYRAAGFEPFGIVDTPLGIPAARLRLPVARRPG